MDSHTGGWFSEYISLLHDPSHWLFEITVQIVIDLLIIYFGYRIIWKKVILPKLRKEIHAEIDQEHNLTHEEEDDVRSSIGAVRGQ